MSPIIKVILVVGVLLLTTGTVCAEEKAGPEVVKVETKEVIGQLVSLNPWRSPQYIGIACKGTNYDAYFKLDEEVRIVHKRSLDEIKLGDMVSVTYDVVTEVTVEGKELTKRIAKAIKFVRQGKEDSIREPGTTTKKATEEPSSRTKALMSLEKKR